ncbi:MAG: arylsulfatase [Sedimentisphaerales bacterium]|nr:arylsulfatase [Sedimentisphaerales bacterium]
MPLPAETITLPMLLQMEGYRTAAMGKWGLGGPDSTGQPNKQGFNQWFGYLCQRIAHNYYPEHLWKNQTKYPLKNKYFSAHQKFPPSKDPNDPANYESYTGVEYAPDLMTEEALAFIRANRNRPFFLYLPYTIPHVALQVPQDSLKEYEGTFPEIPYLGEKGYLPHRAPRAAYAAMVSRMDGYVGRIMTLLKELQLDDDTLVFFSSDNGPTFNGGSDSAFFESAGPLRGLKGSVYEGGIRVPMIARWPGRIKAGSTTDHVSAFWDVMSTVMEAIGSKNVVPKNIDGISFLPTLLGKGNQCQHDYLYWEYHSGGGRQAVRMGDWKGVRLQVGKGNRKIELYNLKKDIGETTDVVDKYPEITARIDQIMETARTESEHFNFGRK